MRCACNCGLDGSFSPSPTKNSCLSDGDDDARKSLVAPPPLTKRRERERRTRTGSARAVSRDARRSPCGAPPCARRERRPQPTAHGTGTDRGRRDGEPICCHRTAGIPQLHSCARLCAAAYTPAAAAGPEGIGFLLAARAHARGDASAARRPRAVGKNRRYRGCQRPSHRVLRPAVVAQGAGDPVQALGGLKRAAREEACVYGRAQG